MITLGYRNKLSGIFMAVGAIAVGLIFLAAPENAISIVIKVLAAFLVASGIVSVVYGYVTRENGGMNLMLVNSIVDIALGIVIYLSSNVLSKFILFFLGLVLVVLAFREFIALFIAKKFVNVKFWTLLMPLLSLVGGMFLMFNPFSEKAMGIICSVALLVFGVSELFSSIKVGKAISRYDISMTDERSRETTRKENEFSDVKDAEFTKVD